MDKIQELDKVHAEDPTEDDFKDNVSPIINGEAVDPVQVLLLGEY